MAQVNDYEIIRGMPAEVEDQIKQMLPEWQPHGVLMQFKMFDHMIVMQVMVKREIISDELARLGLKQS